MERRTLARVCLVAFASSGACGRSADAGDAGTCAEQLTALEHYFADLRDDQRFAGWAASEDIELVELAGDRRAPLGTTLVLKRDGVAVPNRATPLGWGEGLAPLEKYLSEERQLNLELAGVRKHDAGEVGRDAHLVLAIDRGARWEGIAAVIEAARKIGFSRVSVSLGHTSKAQAPPASAVTDELAAISARKSDLMVKGREIAAVSQEVAKLCPPVAERLAKLPPDAVASPRPDVIMDAYLAGLRECDCQGLAEHRSLIGTLAVVPKGEWEVTFDVADGGTPFEAEAGATWGEVAPRLARLAADPPPSLHISVVR